MRRTGRAVGPAIVLMLVASGCQQDRDPFANQVSPDAVRGDVIRLTVDGEPWMFLPHLELGKPCIAHVGPHSGGGYCYVAVAADWVLETALERAGGTTILVGFARKRTAFIEIPDGETLRRVRPEYSFEDLDVFIVPLQDELQGGNRIAAYDARNRKLGNEHNNVGTGRCPYYGPYDGTHDRAIARPVPRCAVRLGLV